MWGISGNMNNLFGLSAGAMAINPILGLSMGAVLADTASQWHWNQKNYSLQERTYDYNRMLQALMMSREDNSVARRVADLKASGLSPVLAAGQGAGVGPVIQTNTPQGIPTTIGDKATLLMALMRQEADISKTYAENKYVEMQSEAIPYKIASDIANTIKSSADAKRSEAETYRIYKDAEFLTSRKMASDMDNLLKQIDVRNAQATGQTGQGALGKILNDITGGFAESMDYQGKPNLQKIINEPKKRTNKKK